MTWQPIETAPKNGEMILLGVDSGFRFFAQSSFWMARRWVYWEHFLKPTHWMPMPEPPEDPFTSAPNGKPRGD